MTFVKEEFESSQSSPPSDLPPHTPPLCSELLKLGEAGIDESESTFEAACRREEDRQLPTVTAVRNVCIEFALHRNFNKKTPIKCYRRRIAPDQKSKSQRRCKKPDPGISSSNHVKCLPFRTSYSVCVQSKEMCKTRRLLQGARWRIQYFPTYSCVLSQATRIRTTKPKDAAESQHI